MSALGELLLGKLSRDPSAGDTLNAAYEAKHNDVRACMDELERLFPRFNNNVGGWRVLDIGCGEGVETLAISKLGAAFVHGIDIHIDRERNDKVRSQAARPIEFSTMDATRMTFPDGAFDVAVTCGSFEHFADPFAVLKECARVIKPGGTIFLTSGVWAHPYGAHMNFFTNVPWVHYLFSERTIMSVRKKYRGDGAMRYHEVPGGLNKVGIASFRRMVRELGLRYNYLKLNAIKDLTLMTKIPYVNELFCNLIVAMLEKPEIG
jgi:SAM-dependent methyltransferase